MYNYDCDSIIKLEKYYEIIMIMCIHYSVTIKNDSEIPIITRMKDRLKPNTHPQNRTLSRLFQKKGQDR